MKKYLIVIGIMLMLLAVGLSGCVEQSNEQDNEQDNEGSNEQDNEGSRSIVGIWYREDDISMDYFVEYYDNGTWRSFMYYEGGDKPDYISDYDPYKYDNNILVTEIINTTIWDIEWLDSDTFIETSRDTGSSNVFNRVASLPT